MGRSRVTTTTSLTAIAGAGLVAARHPGLMYLITGAVALLLGLVVGAAILSRRRYRRNAAFAILTLIAALMRLAKRPNQGIENAAGRDCQADEQTALPCGSATGVPASDGHRVQARSGAWPHCVAAAPCWPRRAPEPRESN